MALYPGSKNDGLPGWGFVIVSAVFLGLLAFLPSPGWVVDEEEDEDDA